MEFIRVHFLSVFDNSRCAYAEYKRRFRSARPCNCLPQRACRVQLLRAQRSVALQTWTAAPIGQHALEMDTGSGEDPQSARRSSDPGLVVLGVMPGDLVRLPPGSALHSEWQPV